MKSNSRDKKKFKRDVLFLLTQDLESPSGLGRYFPLAKNLVKQGLSVTIAALHSNFASLEQQRLIQEGIDVAYVSQMHVKKEASKTEYFTPLQLIGVTLRATWRLLQFLVKNPADVVVIGKPHPMNSVAGLVGGLLTGAKIVLDCDDFEAASNYFTSAWQQRVVRTFENWMPKLVQHVTTNTIFSQERMANLGIPKEKMTVIPNGVDRERFQSIDDTKTEQMIRDLNFGNERVIAYIGSLSLDNHPVDLLIKAFKIIAGEIPDVKLLVVGGGKDLEALRELAANLDLHNEVIFVGRVSPDAVPYYYQMADVSVDPVDDTDAARGRCPLKMFESWAMKTPFVTADVGDRKHLAGDSQSTLLAKPGNPEDLAAQLIMVLNDPRLADTLRENGEKRVEQFYWWSIVDRHMDIFKKP